MLEHDLQVNIINNREVHFTKLKVRIALNSAGPKSTRIKHFQKGDYR
jgi:hypothetical protein